jgi:chemotaxis protein methyltransferase CheR
MELTEGALVKLNGVIRSYYGYDFSGYSHASFLRRINRFNHHLGIKSLDELLHYLTIDFNFQKFLQEVTVNVTELFRDPSFFKSLREKVIPELKTYPLIRIWDAGCSTGEETYSLSIILVEENLKIKSKIYATDINRRVLLQAENASYNVALIKNNSCNYFNSGGKASLSDYYSVQHHKITFNDPVKKDIVFTPHNLATDSSFNEFNLIVCRNVLIYFKRELQERVVKLFLDSLPVFGYLALGTKESLLFSKYRNQFEVIDSKERIFRKISNG